MAQAERPEMPRSPHEWDRLIDALDPPALLLLIEGRMSPALRGHCGVEDIWQESLLHAWRDRERCEWRGLKAFRSWLLTIIDNRIREAADHLGAQKRGGGHAAIPFSVLAARQSPGGNSTPTDDPNIPQSTTPSRIAVQRERAEAIRAALTELPDELREVVRLRLIEQLSIEEIAARLEIGASAVRHRFRRGAELYATQLRRMLASGFGSRMPGPQPAPQSDAAPPGRPESSPPE
jgi:RNA polymerase sigma factor (sigma-70 family)